jgi:hypothetical protein
MPSASESPAGDGMEAWGSVQDLLAEKVAVPVHFERIAATVEHRDRYIDFTHPAKKPKNDDATAVTRMRNVGPRSAVVMRSGR